jgi:single-stranded DNA-binding protein
MSRNNHCFLIADLTGNIFFNYISIKGKEIPFLCLYGFVKSTPSAAQVDGLRIVAYGPLAELVYAYVQKGSRIFVIGHVQQRELEGKIVTEVVAEEVQFLRNINWEMGVAKRQELVDRGELRPHHVYDDRDEGDEE